MRSPSAIVLRNLMPLIWALLYLVSTNDIYGIISLHDFKVKPFIFILILGCCFLGFAGIFGRRRREIQRNALWLFLIPTLTLTAWDCVASYLHLGRLSVSPYAVVIALSFATLFAARALAIQFRFSALRVLIVTANCLSGLGICQFLFSMFGVPVLTASDWWIRGYLPRVNGLTYEPSYYALCLFPFTIALVSLASSSRSRELRRRCWPSLFSLGAAIGFGSSRLSIFFAVLVVLTFLLWTSFRNIAIGRTRLYGAIYWLLGLTIAISSLVVLEKLILYRYPAAHSDTFANGTGLNGTSSRSMTDRLDRLRSTLQVAKLAPLTGIGLGNISYEIYLIETQANPDFNRNLYIPMNPFAELWAGWGLVGTAAFVIYCLSLLQLNTLKRLTRRKRELANATLLAALLTICLLQYNQNFFRFYLWWFFGFMLATIQSRNSKFALAPAERSPHAAPSRS